MTTWPANDREWARAQIDKQVGCNVGTCPNGKCQATGECIEQVRLRQAAEQSDQRRD